MMMVVGVGAKNGEAMGIGPSFTCTDAKKGEKSLFCCPWGGGFPAKWTSSCSYGLLVYLGESERVELIDKVYNDWKSELSCTFLI